MNIETAITLATQCHFGQTDKGGLPYILHPLHVMDSVATKYKAFFNEEDLMNAMCVAVLHDVLEDSHTDAARLYELRFNAVVVENVSLLTKRDHQPYKEYIDAILTSKIASIVKLADIEHNMDMTRLQTFDDDQLGKRLSKYKAAKKKIEQKWFGDYMQFKTKSFIGRIIVFLGVAAIGPFLYWLWRNRKKLLWLWSHWHLVRLVYALEGLDICPGKIDKLL